MKGFIKKVWGMVKSRFDEVNEIFAALAFIKLGAASLGLTFTDEQWFWVEGIVNLVCMVLVAWGIIEFNPKDAKLLSKDKAFEVLIRLAKLLFKK